MDAEHLRLLAEYTMRAALKKQRDDFQKKWGLYWKCPGCGARGAGDGPSSCCGIEQVKAGYSPPGWPRRAGDDDLLAENARLRRACIMQNHEVCETLGAALFGPTPDDAPGPIWAMHTAETLAVEAAEEIAKLRQEKREREAPDAPGPIWGRDFLD